MPGTRDSGLTPTERTPPDPTPVRAAAPGRREEMSSDARITSRIPRPADLTPPPLPPSPAADDARQWLARSLPPSETNPLAPAPSVDLTAPVPQERGAPTWLFPLLLAVTALVVGMVLGALLFGRRNASCPPAQGVHGSSSPTSSSRAAEVTALYTATERRSA